MLKKNGKTRPPKKVKCKACGDVVDIGMEDIEEVAGSKIAVCPSCLSDIVLKK